jgi:hypothetical protein
MLISAALIILINKGYIGEDTSSRVYDIQLSVLREIELNDNLRSQILCAPDDANCINPPTLPEGGIEDENSDFPEEVKNKINERMPDAYICKSKICELDKICELFNYEIDKDIYAQAVSITATLEEYSPRQLKMFCWVN